MKSLVKTTIVKWYYLTVAIVASTVRLPTKPSAYFLATPCDPTILLRPATPQGSHVFSDPRPVRPRDPANPAFDGPLAINTVHGSRWLPFP